MLSEREEDALIIIMTWMDGHVDADGIRQVPTLNSVIPPHRLQHVKGLYKKGYLKHQASSVYPTAKAEAWWARRKTHHG